MGFKKPKRFGALLSELNLSSVFLTEFDVFGDRPEIPVCLLSNSH